MWSKTVVFLVLCSVIWANVAQAYPQRQSQGQDQSHHGPCGPPPSGIPPSGPPPSGPPPNGGLRKGGPCGPPPSGNPPSATTASSRK